MPEGKSPDDHFAPERLPELWKAMGIVNPLEQYVASRKIEEIASSYWARPKTVAQYVNLLKQLQAARTKATKIMERLGPAREAIAYAAFLLVTPELDVRGLLARIDITELPRPDTEQAIVEDRSIEFLINHPDQFSKLLYRTNKNDYRKRPERALIIEPFLQLLDEYDVVPSRTRPLIKMVEALYRVIGIETPPSKEGVRQIVSDLKKKNPA